MRVGTDEAGKGPVLGSMFAAAVRAPASVLPQGTDDSKALTPARREELAARLYQNDQVGVAIAEIPVERIDNGCDMNTLTVVAHAAALSEVVTEGDSVLADACDVDAGRFARRIVERISVDIDVFAEHGADRTDEVVGAASIIAKVTRDEHVADLCEQYGEVGSGYPSDPLTRTFLREYVRANGCLPECARKSWATSTDVLSAAEQSSLDSF